MEAPHHRWRWWFLGEKTLWKWKTVVVVFVCLTVCLFVCDGGGVDDRGQYGEERVNLPSGLSSAFLSFIFYSDSIKWRIL